jgi:hypothetical protein
MPMSVASRAARLLLPGVIAFTAGMLLADIAPDPYAQGTALVPVNYNSRVRMAEEKVTIRKRGDTIHVRAWFLMQNDAQTEKLDVGFLGRKRGELRNFKARVGGKPVAVKDGKPPKWRPISHGMPPDADWKYWRMTFPANSRTEVEVEYDAAAEGRPALRTVAEGGPLTPEQARALIEVEIPYMLQSAQQWSGRIGRASIVLDLDVPIGGRLIHLRPAPATILPRQILWDLRDHYPDEDVRVRFYVNSTRAEAIKLLTRLSEQHPANREIAELAGRRLQESGQPLAAAGVYERHLLATPRGNIYQDLDMAAFAVVQLDAAGEAARLRRLIPRVRPVFEELKKSNAGLHPSQIRGRPRPDGLLAICSKYGG